jgi:transcriptional regulator with XRE-family HTH domain
MIDIDSLVKTPLDLQIIIASNFKKRRKEHKLTQIKLSATSGVPLASIKRFEQIGEIFLKSLIKLSQALDNEKELINIFSKHYYTNIEDMLNE